MSGGVSAWSIRNPIPVVVLFLALTLAGLAFAAIAALLPNTITKAVPASLLDQVRVLGSGRLLLVFAMTALGYGGTFVAFTFLAPILQDVTGFSESSW